MASALDLLKKMSREWRELDVGLEVAEVHGAPDAVTFLRDYVAANRPAIFRGAVAHWPALRLWSRAHLEAAAGQEQVTVDVTPNGRGDAVTQFGVGPDGEPLLCFCTPHQRRMALAEFLQLFFDTKQQPSEGAEEIPYLQHQNSNLTEELAPLLADVERELPWAAEAFGAGPDAVNVWIGDERAATTFHKDHYENLYCMVAGTKRFHLLPPCDAFRMALRQLPPAAFGPDGPGGRLVPVLDAAEGGNPPRPVTWSPVEPQPKDPAQARRQYPLFFDASLHPPLVATIGPGDVLFLPSMWYHHVAQEPEPSGRGEDWVVAVNYWYDMHYGPLFAYFQLAEGLAASAGLLPLLSEDGDADAADDGGSRSSGGGGGGGNGGSSRGGGEAGSSNSSSGGGDEGSFGKAASHRR